VSDHCRRNQTTRYDTLLRCTAFPISFPRLLYIWNLLDSVSGVKDSSSDSSSDSYSGFKSLPATPQCGRMCARAPARDGGVTDGGGRAGLRGGWDGPAPGAAVQLAFAGRAPAGRGCGRGVEGSRALRAEGVERVAVRGNRSHIGGRCRADSARPGACTGGQRHQHEACACVWCTGWMALCARLNASRLLVRTRHRLVALEACADVCDCCSCVYCSTRDCVRRVVSSFYIETKRGDTCVCVCVCVCE
jgi:hypothetical protein